MGRRNRSRQARLLWQQSISKSRRLLEEAYAVSTDSYMYEKEWEAEEGGKGAAVVGRGIDSTAGIAEVDIDILSFNVRLLYPLGGRKTGLKKFCPA